MELQIPFGAYTGKATPFGGPSLEWESENPLPEEEFSDDARFSVRNVPLIVNEVAYHIKRLLPREWPKSTANVQRRVLTLGIPIIESIVGNSGDLVDKKDKALMSSTITSMKELSLRSSRNYLIELGTENGSQQTIYARSKGQVSTVKGIAEDLGLPISKVTILCLIAGLAQSVDKTWVPEHWRSRFIEEIRDFKRWLKKSWV